MSRTAAVARIPSSGHGHQGDVRGEGGAVAAAPGQCHPRAHRPGFRISHISRPVLRMRRAGGLRNQHFDLSALQLFPPVPEQAFRLGVDHDDPAIPIHVHHRVRVRVQERGEPVVREQSHANYYR